MIDVEVVDHRVVAIRNGDFVAVGPDIFYYPAIYYNGWAYEFEINRKIKFIYHYHPDKRFLDDFPFDLISGNMCSLCEKIIPSKVNKKFDIIHRIRR